MLSQTAVFTQRIDEHTRPAAIVPVTGDCGQIVDEMRRHDAGAAIVVDEIQRPVGIVTERDVARRIALTVEPATPVTAVMTHPVQTIDAQDYLHRAVARMRRDGFRHLPVMDGVNVHGVLELDQVMIRLSAAAVQHIDLVNFRDGATELLTLAKNNQFKVASRLLDDAVPAPEIQALLSRLNADLYQAVVGASLRALADLHGPPPVDFDVIVMGSGGRKENYLGPDQDNGIIIADYDDAEHERIDSWFLALSEQLTHRLNAVGFPFCKGHVMATNPMWRKPISQWREQISGWIRKGEGNFLRLCDIFFDFDCVYGVGELTTKLREHVTHNAARRIFLREMFKVDEEHDVALGPFGILLRDRVTGPQKGKVNLKLAGTLPLVGAVRLLALWYRVPATSTLERIEQLKQAKALSADEADYLSGAYTHISALLMRQQLRDAKAGLPASNHVAPESLSKRERDMLVAGFRAIRRFRSRLRTELTGELF